MRAALRPWGVLQTLAFLAQMLLPLIFFASAHDGEGVRMKAKDQLPIRRALRLWVLTQDTSFIKFKLPVREHTVTASFEAHGFGDVAGDKDGFSHGISKVSRGLKHSVVGHEVSGTDSRVIAEDVNG